MARLARPKPKHLAKKLRQVREKLGLSQSELLVRLGMDERYNRSVISGYELGSKEPPLPILLKYARLANISTDILIDDKLNLTL